ncbi:Elongation factor, GTP-binding domain-containing protein [Cynara cardunculus var. scolymus]|uniref:Elongation factor, GTP-binding domain-containing protein n=1 Tax=Cynara cardunculus var. scolymus TaxID=59895 RepID=A0A118JYH7_CYNCS|nr:Elongation factor, GTP-binding domain-containing protein [Cynara cardunculus var. scolymus]
MGRKKPAAREEDGVVGGGKSRKKAVVIDDDEYSFGTELSEEKPVQEEEHVAPVAGKKKGKKGNQKNLRVNDDEEDVEDDQEIQFTGKKKPSSKAKKGGNSFAASGFALLGDEDDETSDVTKDEEDDVSEEEDASVVFSGKKKSSKSKKGGSLFTGSAFDAIGDDDGDLVDNSGSKQQSEDEDDEPIISFTGKKKSSKSNKKPSGSIFSASHFDGLDEGENEKGSDVDDQDDAPVTFSGKKKSTKSSKKKNSPSDIALTGGGTDEEVSVSGLSIDDVADRDEDSSIKFSGKKKPSKKKNSNTVDAADEHEQPSTSITSKEADVPETSKNKKKKKKGGRTAQEEDDLDKILAELGETPAPAPATVQQPQEEKVQPQAEPATVADEGGEKDANEETVESAAAKKKKKKKEKEKEKKAAGGKTTAAPAVEEKQAESKSKVPDKKVPKHVREMQERLARLKEAEEKKKREEEEKLRKEEEERQRQEELERIAEEKKRLKKEREKEKMLKKKQEGKLLTAKQKEEARRLEAMRNQILANAGGLPLPTGDTSRAQTKRPKYQTKKSKSHPQANGKASSTKATEITEARDNQEDNVSELGSVEAEKADDVDMENMEAPAVEENGNKEDEEEDDEWDAKSWDDADLKLPGISAFADEEEVTEAEPKHKLEPVPVVKKEIKSASNSSVVPHLTKELHQNLESKEIPPATVVANKGKQQDVKGKKEEKKEEEGEKTLRSPICCIMGHVDTGKTKLLDCIRRTNVQEGEAGGITQQIGATYIPAENIRERTKELKADAKLNVPGLLVIDTPGHESFKNLRSRGSGLCDIAILVVDIMHGLEPQTIESLNLLRMRNTEFIVALNKVDKLYGWKTCRNAPIGKAMKLQSKDVQLEFEHRVTQVITEFKEQGLNTELYNKNKDRGETYSIVPTSAISGEGIPEMLLLLVQWAQKTMVEKLTYSSEIQCTVLEVKVIEGLGTTIDVVLVNGVLHEGDEIVVCGFQASANTLLGPIHTSIRSLLTPHPMKELRVKGAYIHHKEIKAAQGIKITAQNLEHAVAGTALYVVGPDDDVEEIKESVMDDMRNIGTPICIPQREFIDIGRISSIENNHKPVSYAKKGQKVAIKITGSNAEEQQKMFGRHFEMEDELVSRISRNSIDILKTNYRDELSNEEWRLVVKLKNLFKIQ